MNTWKPHGPLGQDDKLYFLHIPKTAGTALRTFLESRFAVDEICPYLTTPEIIPHPPSALARYRLFCGHHGMYLPRIIRAEPAIVTVLREPIERCVSHFRHLQATTNDWLHEKVRGKTFEQFVMSEDGVVELLNFQTRFLVNDDLRRDYYGHSVLRQTDLKALEAKYADPSQLVRATALLDRAAFVGVQERFDDGLRLLSYTFGWPPVTTFPKYNTAKVAFDPSGLTPAAMDRLNELTLLDRALYDHARTLFESRLARVTPEAAENAYREAMLARPRLHRVAYGFDQPIFGDNWLTRERPEGQWRRWSGPGTRTTLDLPLATDRPLLLRFFVGAQTPDVMESMRLTVNGVEQEPDWWPMHDPPRAQRTYELVLEPDLLRLNPAYTRLTFDVNRVVVPAEEWPDRTDKRRLALYFFWIEVNPR
ncbi:MAG: sulfotransferase family 2 domain-containing protein [Phycisphaeraceae bacterium]|nr:sulfotransferase family 2 domain-containing protein [Phycisphaeraceae bacterium]